MKFGDPYDRLVDDLPAAGYTPFRNLLRDHIATTWTLRPGDMLRGEPVLERHNHSILSTAHETGIDPRRMRKLLVEARCAQPSGEENEDAWQRFNAKASMSFLVSLNQYVSAIDLLEGLWLGPLQEQYDRQHQKRRPASQPKGILKRKHASLGCDLRQYLRRPFGEARFRPRGRDRPAHRDYRGHACG